MRLAKGKIELRVNGQVRQSGDITEMIWSVPELVSQSRALVDIAPGDLIFTGTPRGRPAPVVKGESGLRRRSPGFEPLRIAHRLTSGSGFVPDGFRLDPTDARQIGDGAPILVDGERIGIAMAEEDILRIHNP